MSIAFRLSAEKEPDEMLDRLVLDIKAFVLLQGDEAMLRRKVEGRLVESHDEEVRSFVQSIRAGRKPAVGQLIIVGVGELLVASLLVVTGTVILMPTLLGINSPQALLLYFSSQILSGMSDSPFSPYASALEFVVGAFILLAAFYTLRQAAVNLRELGLTVKISEE